MKKILSYKGNSALLLPCSFSPINKSLALITWLSQQADRLNYPT